jgi:hypothetical protein
MQLRECSSSSTLTLSNQFILPVSVTKYGMIYWTICPAEARYVLYKRKLLVLWLVQNLELHVEVF